MRIAIFYHIYQDPDSNWIPIVDNQIELLSNSGLLNAAEVLYIGLNGDQDLPPFPIDPTKMSVNTNSDWRDERETLRALKKFGEDNEDFVILYIHNKGVTDPDNTNIKDWVDILNYFCITRWKDCLKVLETRFGAVGALLKERHYHGNFWWADAGYIKSLPDTKLHREYKISFLECDPEYWIGDGGIENLHGIYTTLFNHYDTPYPKHLYEGYRIEKVFIFDGGLDVYRKEDI